MLTDTNLFVCAGCEYNKALPSGQIAEKRTRLLLEIHAVKCDYKVALSEENLRTSQLWSFLEEVNQGITVPYLDLVLPILCLQYAIHVVFRGSDLQQLTTN